jgi:hypothetical protein
MSVAVEPSQMALPELSDDQIPAFVTTDAQLYRWRVCVGIMFQVAQRPDWNFAVELYNGPLETGDPAEPPAEAAE